VALALSIESAAALPVPLWRPSAWTCHLWDGWAFLCVRRALAAPPAPSGPRIPTAPTMRMQRVQGEWF